MSHNTLQNYYSTIHSMVHQYRFGSITELENMIPFELEVYRNIISNEAQKRQDAAKVEESLLRNQLNV